MIVNHLKIPLIDLNLLPVFSQVFLPFLGELLRYKGTIIVCLNLSLEVIASFPLSSITWKCMH